MNSSILLLVFFPVVGFLVILGLKEEWKNAIRWTALATSLVTFALAVCVLAQFDPAKPGLQVVYDGLWSQVAGATISFSFGVDGLSILMVLLTAFLTPLAILSTWNAVADKVKGFMLFFLLLEMGMLGVFTAQDLVLFYIFWEFTLIPMYFLIGIWGGARRIYATVKFFLFTMSGSVLMLLGIIYLGLQLHTFSVPALIAGREVFAGAQMWLFIYFAAAFAIKVPIWPFHSWLPDAHVEAPTAGSVILAGVMLKMGTYGFLRFNLPLFPQASLAAAPVMVVLALIGIIYGAFVAYTQKDVKKLVAYSSVSHLGFVILGIFAFTTQSLSGSILQMVNHGLSTGALFLIVGMLYERRHTREIADYGGIWKAVPVMGALMLFVSLSSAGLPGLNGFVGEFTILVGAFASPVLHSPWFAGVAALGVILAAVYLLVMFEKVFLGPLDNPENKKLKDVSLREVIVLVPILIVILWIGVYPQFFFALINPSVERLVALVQTASVAVR